MKIKRAALLSEFECLGDKCEDTCCRGWGMQLDEKTKTLYKQEAPELLHAVTSGEAEIIMRRDPATDYCVKLEGGLCGIHKKYGTKFLGDACNFYPRITRRFGKDIYMSASLSCPEIARLALTTENPFAFTDAEAERLPESTRNYLYDGDDISEEAAEKIMQAFINLTQDKGASAERVMARVVSLAFSLENLPRKSWADAIGFYCRTVDERLPPPEESPNDNYFLLQILVALVSASKKTARPKLEEIIAKIKSALEVEIEPESFAIIKTGNKNIFRDTNSMWKSETSVSFAMPMKKWIAAELSMASFPFAGFGESIKDRAVIIAVRFATLNLALVSYLSTSAQNKNATADARHVAEIAQTLARFLDHLADPKLSILSYSEAGWSAEARLRSLIGDKS